MTITQTDSASEEQVMEALREHPQMHPALARLRENLVGDGSSSQVITSYDRLHHRHNRS